MNSKATELHHQAKPREVSAQAYAYSAIALFAAILIYMMCRAALIISRGSTGINAEAYLITHLLTALFEIILWVIIAKAAVRFKSYARAVIQGDDGQALDYVANALLLSLLYAMLFGMASTAKTLFLHTPYLTEVTTITNLLPLAVILLSTIYLFTGTLRLRRISLVKSQSTGKSLISLSLLLYLVVITTYVLYFYHVAPRLLDDDGLHHFALSAHALLLIYALPYAVVWLLGLLACLNLAHYSHQVVGTIYKLLFRDLYRGLVMSFIGTYLVQIFYVSNVSSNQFGVGLLIIIALLSLLIYGCLMIYRGTNQLYLLEK